MRKVRLLHGGLPWSSKMDWCIPADDLDTLTWPFRYDGPLDVDMAHDAAKPYLSGHRVAVQAGGAIGIWPVRLGQLFEKVHTFEPEPVNYECLSKNTRGMKNVLCYNAALSDASGMVSMHLDDDYAGHCGAFYTKPGGRIPAVTIDSLRLRNVDFMWLDIEGGETAALMGAAKTIERCRPVIGFEHREFSARYSGPTPINYLKGMGYKLKGKIYGHDYLMIHEAATS